MTMPQRDATAPRTGRRVGLLAALAVSVAAFLAFAAQRHGFFDLKVYYGALNFWVHDGGMLYDFLSRGRMYGFPSPPFAALVMLPMAYVPWALAMVISVGATVVTSLLLLWWLVDPVARREGWSRWFALGVAACLA